MLDIQKLMDAIGESARIERTSYHLTLGDLIDCLKGSPADARVHFDHGAGLATGSEHSYRGYYSDLAFASGEARTVNEVLACCNAALGSTFKGYKGGDFVMGEDTPLWNAAYGCCGLAIIDAKPINGALVLITKDIG